MGGPSHAFLSVHDNAIYYSLAALPDGGLAVATLFGTIEVFNRAPEPLIQAGAYSISQGPPPTGRELNYFVSSL